MASRDPHLEHVARDPTASISSEHEGAACVRVIEARDLEAAYATMRTYGDTNQGVPTERIERAKGASR